MIELYVLATLSAMGYLLNKTSSSVSTKSNALNKNELPSVDSIYSSNHFERVKELERRKAAKAFELSRNPTKTNVISRNFGALKQDEFVPPKVKSLTGNFMDTEKFTHNNMVPFFGGNIKQNLDENSSKSILENFTGVSDTYQNKKEVACMYDTSKDFGNVNGMKNQDDFYRERLEESRNKNNVVPIPQVRVGPGVGKGYDAGPTGGFHQFDAQDIAMSYYKPVDELRVASKPKTTFEARTVDGQREILRADVPNLVKNKVETFFEQTPDMLLKTTGAYTKAAEIPEFNVKTTNRLETTREEMGNAGVTVSRRKLDEPNVKPTNRQQLKEFGIRNSALNTIGKADKDDYGKSKILVYNNERDITTTRVHQGNVTSLIKAIVAPLQDVIRVNKKEHAVDNPRHFGNMSIQVPDKPTMYDPNDIARTTIKETLIHDEMGTGAISGPKKLAVYDPDEIAKKTIRETLERMDYEMNIGPNVPKGAVYDPDDTLRTTMKETLVEETHEGNINRLEGMGNYVNDYIARNTQKQFASDNDYYGTAARGNTDGYKTNKYDARNTQKQFLSDNDYYGVSGSAYRKKQTSMEDMNNAVITERKEVTLFGREPTKEGKKIANGGEGITLGIKKIECDITARRATANADRIIGQKIPDSTDLNITKSRSFHDIKDNRLDPDLLQPFLQNPYTQPLTSVF
jgi:hypothetical protein